jgi:hypothetical protein
MFRRMLVVLFALMAAAAVVAPNSLLACEACRFSPDRKFGFCRTLYPTQYGATSCETVVVDTFNGNTSCLIGGTCNPANPYNPFDPINGGGGDGGGGYCWADYYFYSYTSPGLTQKDSSTGETTRLRGSSKVSVSRGDQAGGVRSLMMSQNPGGDCTELPVF